MSGIAYDYLLKLILIGDSGVGKSSIVYQLIEQKSKQQSEPTIGVQFAAKTMEINQNKIKLQIWDTAGQQNYRSIVKSYYRGAIGSLLIYDITRRESFQNIKNWLNQVHNNGNSHMHILLVGNKNDLKEARKVSIEQGENLAAQLNLSFIEISAKDYQKVSKVFSIIVEEIIQKIKNGSIPQNTPGIRNAHMNTLLDSKKHTKKYYCC